MTQKYFVNVTEEIVCGLVKFILNGTEYQTFCHCEECEMRISACALNQLPSYYVTSAKEREIAFRQLNSDENVALINKAIINAIYSAGKQPNHKTASL